MHSQHLHQLITQESLVLETSHRRQVVLTFGRVLFDTSLVDVPSCMVAEQGFHIRCSYCHQSESRTTQLEALNAEQQSAKVMMNLSITRFTEAVPVVVNWASHVQESVTQGTARDGPQRLSPTTSAPGSGKWKGIIDRIRRIT